MANEQARAAQREAAGAQREAAEARVAACKAEEAGLLRQLRAISADDPAGGAPDLPPPPPAWAVGRKRG